MLSEELMLPKRTFSTASYLCYFWMKAISLFQVWENVLLTIWPRWRFSWCWPIFSRPSHSELLRVTTEQSELSTKPVRVYWGTLSRSTSSCKTENDQFDVLHTKHNPQKSVGELGNNDERRRLLGIAITVNEVSVNCCQQSNNTTSC